jgi:hypothetical protein
VLWAPLSRIERYALVALTLSAVIGPWVTSYPIVGGAAMTALMVGIFGYLVWAISRRNLVRLDDFGLLVGLGVAFLAMAIGGLALVVTAGAPGSVLAFGTIMAVVMTVEIAYLLRRYYVGTSERPWVARRSSDAEEPPAVRAPVPSGIGEARPRETTGLAGR